MHEIDVEFSRSANVALWRFVLPSATAPGNRAVTYVGHNCTMKIVSAWPIAIDEVFQHIRDVTALIGGGNSQSGITRPHGWRDVLVFSNPGAAERNGYADREGLRENGDYWYAAQGKQGDQHIDKGPNKSLLDTRNNGGVIRLFIQEEGSGYHYVGPFGLAEIPYVQTNEHPRLYTFCLTPQGADTQLLNELAQGGGDLDPHSGTVRCEDWKPKSTILAEIPEHFYENRQAQQLEHAQEQAFGEWLKQQGNSVLDLHLRIAGREITADLFNASDAEIIEAKSSNSRGHVRMAIGQVLDYVHNFNERQSQMTDNLPSVAKPAILLPNKPEPDLIALCASLEIKLYIPSENGMRRFAELTQI